MNDDHDNHDNGDGGDDPQPPPPLIVAIFHYTHNHAHTRIQARFAGRKSTKVLPMESSRFQVQARNSFHNSRSSATEKVGERDSEDDEDTDDDNEEIDEGEHQHEDNDKAATVRKRPGQGGQDEKEKLSRGSILSEGTTFSADVSLLSGDHDTPSRGIDEEGEREGGGREARSGILPLSGGGVVGRNTILEAGASADVTPVAVAQPWVGDSRGGFSSMVAPGVESGVVSCVDSGDTKGSALCQGKIRSSQDKLLSLHARTTSDFLAGAGGRDGEEEAAGGQGTTHELAAHNATAVAHAAGTQPHAPGTANRPHIGVSKAELS